MKEFKKKSHTETSDKEIIFSKAIKAGKRIYYLDVKKNRKGEMFLAVTESKKVVMGEGEDSQVSFEKHKIFLYKEDFKEFANGLKHTIDFIESAQGLHEEAETEEEETGHRPSTAAPDSTGDALTTEEIKIDIDF